MIKIRDIEKTITNLPSKELAEFRNWFLKYDAVKWDKQFENNVKDGKLDKLANKAIADFKNEKCKEL